MDAVFEDHVEDLGLKVEHLGKHLGGILKDQTKILTQILKEQQNRNTSAETQVWPFI